MPRFKLKQLSPSLSLTHEKRVQMKRQEDRQCDRKIKFQDLNDEQRLVADAVLRDGLSVFITGSAGTGKSFLLQFLIHELCVSKCDSAAVAVTRLNELPRAGENQSKRPRDGKS